MITITLPNKVCIVLCCVVVNYVVLCCVVLCYVVNLCCAMLFFTLLCISVLCVLPFDLSMVLRSSINKGDHFWTVLSKIA